jgi:AraC-like DNA-binding protein
MTMTGTPHLMTATPLAPDRAHLLADVLGLVRLTSAVFLRGDFTAPWAFLSPTPGECVDLLARGAKAVVLFHVILEGHCHVALGGDESVVAAAGESVMFPYADQHVMSWPMSTPPVAMAKLLPPMPWARMPVMKHGGGGTSTRVLCGYLHCEDLLFDPLLEALPRLMHVRPATAPAAEWVHASARYLGDETERGRPAGGALARVPELLLIECLRQYAEALAPDHKGWLAALRDPVVGRALLEIHSRPRDAWTVERLARRLAVSRSVLAERFTAMLGRSPMLYLAGWRLQIAANLLRTTDLGLGEIAERVGYASEAGFSRAFKRHVGTPPAAFRERARLQRSSSHDVAPIGPTAHAVRPT